jgi:hypothetical protein
MQQSGTATLAFARRGTVPCHSQHRSRRQRSNSPISLASPPHLFTRSPTPRSISPHIDRAFDVSVHTVDRATIDITPHQSHLRRTCSHGHRSQDRYHRISIGRSTYLFIRSPGPRLISPHINRTLAGPVPTPSPRPRSMSPRVDRGLWRRNRRVRETSTLLPA